MIEIQQGAVPESSKGSMEPSSDRPTSLDKLLKILLNGTLKINVLSNNHLTYKKTFTFTSFYCHTSTALHWYALSASIIDTNDVLGFLQVQNYWGVSISFKRLNLGLWKLQKVSVRN